MLSLSKHLFSEYYRISLTQAQHKKIINTDNQYELLTPH